MMYIHYVHAIDLYCIKYHKHHSVAKISFNPWSRRLLCRGCFFGYTPRTTMELGKVKVTESGAYHITCKPSTATEKKTLFTLIYCHTEYYLVYYSCHLQQLEQFAPHS